MPPAFPGAAAVLLVVLAAAVAALLVAERRRAERAKAGAKTLASTAFVALAVALGATGSPYGRLVLVALLLSWRGDVLLIRRGRGTAFLAGLGAFLLGHAAYAAAFLVQGQAIVWFAAAAAVVLLLAVVTARWLLPHASAHMRLPVLAYLAVISVMVATAWGAAGAGAAWLIPVGATAFAASDVAVARERFVVAEFRNKVWGLPLYYAAQVALAWSAGG